MVIVDTTVWIDYFRGSENPETNWLDAHLTRQLWCMREGQNFSSCWRNCGGRAPRRLRSRYSFVILLVALKESVSELQASLRSLCHSWGLFFTGQMSDKEACRDFLLTIRIRRIWCRRM